MAYFDLSGQVAVVTGAATGITFVDRPAADSAAPVTDTATIDSVVTVVGDTVPAVVAAPVPPPPAPVINEPTVTAPSVCVNP